MFRIKDHIISLVAVFLALGLGILIGTGLSDEMLITQQRLLIDQMTKDVRSLRDERLALESRLQSVTRDLYLWEKYQEALYPGMVGGALEEKRIAFVSQGADIPPGVLRMLQDADATLCSAVYLEGRQTLGADPAEVGGALAALAGGDLLTTEHRNTLQPYLEEQLIRMDRYSAHRPNAVIFVLGERDVADERLIEALAGEFDLEQITVVGLEASDVENSLLDGLKAVGISTVDNADTVFGQFSLLSVLRGSPGNYGIKAAADEFIAHF